MGGRFPSESVAVFIGMRMTGARSQLVYKDLPSDDPTQRRPDITLARTILEWEPKVDLETGLADTIAYFRNLQRAEAARA